MSTRPLVSIGLFLYNGERFLEAAIESFLNQTFKDFELIISDNCSTDRSDEICRRYAAQDSRIRYYRNERNMGAGWNIRRVYELATGKYFKQAAHDDMIQPDYLRQCVDALEADESLVLAHSLTRVIDENGQFIENYDDGMRTSSLDPVVRARDLLLKGHRCYPIFGLIRLDALHKLPPQGSYAHSDRVLLLQLGLLGRYYEVPEYLFISTSHMRQSVWTMPERTKAKGFRLTRRCGTLPAMEWWDPDQGAQDRLAGVECGQGVFPLRGSLTADPVAKAEMLRPGGAVDVEVSPPHGQGSSDRRRPGVVQLSKQACNCSKGPATVQMRPQR